MIVKIVLDGGLRSCCSVYPPEYVKEVVSIWLKGIGEVEVIDRRREDWEPDELASLAQEHFGDRIFPLVYCGDVLAAMGSIPDAAMLSAMAAERIEYGITKEDILGAAGAKDEDTKDSYQGET